METIRPDGISDTCRQWGAPRSCGETPEASELVAVVGIGCRLANGIECPEDLWSVISNKVDCVKDIPKSRFDIDSLFSLDTQASGKVANRQAGIMDDVDKFDPGFFGLSYVDAQRCDPQQRLMLETVYSTLEDAGVRMEDLSDSRTGVFCGVMNHDYEMLTVAPSERRNLRGSTATGTGTSIVANRVSYFFNLKGPSIVCDTACSSSLVALHYACHSMAAGECSQALVGGVSCILKPELMMSMTVGGFLSPTSRCMSFDASANGYVRSEGCGCVLLKPLDKAVRDGDNIYACIRSTSCNQDGSTNGITVPNEDSQKKLLREAYARAGVDCKNVGYVEAHGTGTPTGDPIEGRAIAEIIAAAHAEENPLYMGSVKSNIGHTESASGVVGLIKLVVCLKRGLIPPNLHFNNPNPKIPWNLPIRVPTSVVEWKPAPGGILYGGINSFGFGGTNVHAVVQSPPMHGMAIPMEQDAATPFFSVDGKFPGVVVMLSGKGEQGLTRVVKQFVEFCQGPKAPALGDLVKSLACHRSHFTHRLTATCSSRSELVSKLYSFTSGDPLPGVESSRVVVSNDSKVCFVFSGMGTQWWGMGRRLFEMDEGFRSLMRRIDSLLSRLQQKFKGQKWSLIKEIFEADEASSKVQSTYLAQPGIFAVEVGLFDLWRRMGIRPDAVVGHSVGEIGAAYASGALTLEDATAVIYHRSRLQQLCAGLGSMLAAGMSAAEAEELIQEVCPGSNAVSVAAINSPTSITLSGDDTVLKKISSLLTERDVFNRVLRVEVPFHSHHMSRIEKEFVQSLSSIRPQESKIDFYSTVTGGLLDGHKILPSYWYRNLREPVSFLPAVDSLLSEQFNVFVEVGPHPVLQNYLQEVADAAGRGQVVVVSSLRRKADDAEQLLSNFAAYYRSGAPSDAASAYSGLGERVAMPRYPFLRERFWIETPEGQHNRLTRIAHPHLIECVKTARHGGALSDFHWKIDLNCAEDRWLLDHRVQGPVVFPAAGHMDLALSAGKMCLDDFDCVEDVRFEKALFLPEEGEAPKVQLEVTSRSRRYYLTSQDAGQFSLCSEGKLVYGAQAKVRGSDHSSELLSLADAQAECTETVDFPKIKEILQNNGLYLGPSFAAIEELRRDALSTTAYAVIIPPPVIAARLERYSIHPTVLDAMFQSMNACFAEEIEAHGLYIPVHIDRVRMYRTHSKSSLYFSVGKLIRSDEQHLVFSLSMFDEERKPILHMEEMTTQYLAGGHADKVSDDPESWPQEVFWKFAPLEPSPSIDQVGPLAWLDEDCTAVLNSVERCRKDPKEILFSKFLEQLDQLNLGYIVQAFEALEIELQRGATLVVSELEKKCGVLEAHGRLFRQLFKILCQLGLLEPVQRKGANSEIDGEWVWKVVSSPPSDVGRLIETHSSSLMESYRQFSIDIDILLVSGPILADTLTGKINPVSVLFPAGEVSVILQYYRKSLLLSRYHDWVQAMFESMLSHIPEDRTLRILEVGAGTGGLTRQLLPLLNPRRTEYVFTDLGRRLLAESSVEFADRYPFVSFSLLDLEPDPIEQGFSPHSFDIIIGADVVHATKTLPVVLGHLKKLLRSEGLLVLEEILRGPRHWDLVFGLLEGWWLFDDTHIRTHHCWMGESDWKTLLKSEGFSSTAVFSECETKDDTVELLALGMSSSGVKRKRDNRVWVQPCQGLVVARGPKLPVESASPQQAFDRVIAPVGKSPYVVVFADSGKWRDMVCAALSFVKNVIVVERGASYRDDVKRSRFVVSCARREDFALALSTVVQRFGKLPVAILYGWGTVAQGTGSLSCSSIAQYQREAVLPIGFIAAALRGFRESAESLPLPTQLWVFSERGSSCGNAAEISLVQSSLTGMMRSLSNELHEVCLASLVDTDAWTPESIGRCLLEVMMSRAEGYPFENHIAWYGGERFVPRLRHLEPDVRAEQFTETVPACGSHYQVSLKRPGVWGSAVFTQDRTRAYDDIPDNWCEVEVKFAGINFADIMSVTTLISDEAFKHIVERGTPLRGMECSGVVRRVGGKVRKFKVGDEVFGPVYTAYSGLSFTSERYLWKKPKSVSWENAAGLPIAWITAWLALVRAGGLENALGEPKSVLIHTATGGVGFAAMELATIANCEIFATAGTPEKREFLKKWGVKSDHIFSSRTCEFKAGIKKLTNGSGVDLVLNTLSGDGFQAGLECLSLEGKFLDIAKKEVYTDAPLRLKTLVNSNSYDYIDLMQLLVDTPKYETVTDELGSFFQQNWGRIRFCPTKVFPMAELGNALSFVAAGKHLGKVLLSTEGSVNLQSPANASFQKDGAYLIVGGTSGLGLRVGEWIASRGGGTLILSSRSGCKTQRDRVTVERIRRMGVKVIIVLGDSSSHADCKKMVAHVPEKAKLRGIHFCAMVLADAMATEMTEEQYMTAFRPKACGIWSLASVLDRFRESLDHIVLYSSIASVLGSEGQSNYSAGNSFLDAFAGWHQAQGFPTVSVNIPPVRDAGFLAREVKIRQRLDESGIHPFPQRDIITGLEDAMVDLAPQRSLIHCSWKKIADVFPKTRTPMLSLQTDPIRLSALEFLDDDDVEESPEDMLRSIVSRLLGLPRDGIDMFEPLTSMGLDSMMSTQLRSWILSKFGVEMTTMSLMKGPTLTELLGMIQASSGAKKAVAPQKKQTHALAQAQAAAVEQKKQKAKEKKNEKNTAPVTSARPVAEKKAMSVQKKSPLASEWPAAPKTFDFTTTKEHLKTQVYLRGLKLRGRSVEPMRFWQAERSSDPADGALVMTEEGKLCISYMTYDYLGLIRCPEIRQAAKDAVDQYGTSVSASRMGGGQLPVHTMLEREVSEFVGVDDSIVFLGGHTANLNCLRALFGPGDLIIYDEYSHNSIVEGAIYCGATKVPFSHNDPVHLERLLSNFTGRYKKILICIEGCYSFDGDVPDLAAFIELKQRFHCVLMVDEAHSFGVLGKTGRGVSEHFGIDPRTVDIFMGSMAKSFAGVGGFIAGSKAMVDIVRYNSPGFVYSVGIPPHAAAASLAGVRMMSAHPERVTTLHSRCLLFKKLASENGINIGQSLNHPGAVVPVIVGSDAAAKETTLQLRLRQIMAVPAMGDMVRKNESKLRFFVTASHSEEQIRRTIQVLSEVVPLVLQREKDGVVFEDGDEALPEIWSSPNPVVFGASSVVDGKSVVKARGGRKRVKVEMSSPTPVVPPAKPERGSRKTKRVENSPADGVNSRLAKRAKVEMDPARVPGRRSTRQQRNKM